MKTLNLNSFETIELAQMNMSAKPGANIDNCLKEIISLSSLLDTKVVLTHNEKSYIVTSKELRKTVYETKTK